MPADLIEASFKHHAWATARLLGAAESLTEAQLMSPVAHTYGSVLDTLRHIAGSDSFYLFTLSNDYLEQPDTDAMTLTELSDLAATVAVGWSEYLAISPNPSGWRRDVDPSMCARDATVGLRLAQALHHGNEHRAHVCTQFSSFGLETPIVDAWTFGLEQDLSQETYLLP